MKKKRIFGLAGLAAVVLAAGAGIYYTTSHHGSKGNGDLKVVTSFYPVYEFTKQVVGDEGEVSYLIPAGSEAHDFQPSTKNVADIEKADTFVYLNENMETWVPKVEKSINTKNQFKAWFFYLEQSKKIMIMVEKNITTNMIPMFGSHLNVLKN